jgi:hypothetical protein
LATALTTPTKPIPPTAPVVPPVTMNKPGDSPAAPTNPASTSGSKATTEAPAVGRDMDKSPAAKTEAETTKSLPVGYPNTQEGASAKTTVPADPPVPVNKGTTSGYVWFMVVVIVLAAGLLLSRLYWDRPKLPRAAGADSGRVNTIKDEPSMADRAVSPQQKAKKAKKAPSTFDFRV